MEGALHFRRRLVVFGQPQCTLRKAGHRGPTIMYSIQKHYVFFFYIKACQHILLHQIHKIMIFKKASYDHFKTHCTGKKKKYIQLWNHSKENRKIHFLKCVIRSFSAGSFWSSLSAIYCNILTPFWNLIWFEMRWLSMWKKQLRRLSYQDSLTD